METRCLSFGEHRIDLDRRLLYRGDQLLEPERREFDLLQLLIEAHPQTLTRRELIDRLWPRQEISDASLAQLIRHTRKLLDDDARNPKYLKTLHGIGLRLIPEPIEEIQVTRREPRRRIGLLPVVNASGEAQNDWVEHGLAEILLQKVDAGSNLSIQLIPRNEFTPRQLLELYGCEALLQLRLEKGFLPRILSWELLQAGHEAPLQDRIEAGSIMETAGKLAALLPQLLIQPGQAGADRSRIPSHSDNPDANERYGEALQALEQGDTPNAERLLHLALELDGDFSWARIKLADALYRQCRLDEGRDIIRSLLDSSGLETEQLIAARQVLSNILYSQGEVEASLRESGQLIGLAQASGNRKLEADQWMNLGGSSQGIGDEETAFQAHGRALELYREIGHQLGIGNTLYNLANVHHGLAEWSEAYSLYEQAELIFERCGHANHQAQARFEMAQILRQMGQDADRVRQILQDSRKVFSRTGDAEGEALAEVELIHCDIDDGRYQESIEHLQTIIQRCREQNMAYPLFMARHQLIRAYLNLHQPEQVDELIREVQEFNPSDPMFKLLEAHCAYERRDYPSAIDLASRIREQHKDTWEEQHQRMLESYQQAQQSGHWEEHLI